MTPQITVSPDQALVDELLDVEASGFDPGRIVDLEARTRTRTRAWRATAKFRADGDGVVDPGSQKPIEGPYEDARPMGLFQFATPVDPGELALGETRLRARVDGEVVATSTCERRLRADGVTTTAFDHERLDGTLLRPPGEGPYPGVVFLPGATEAPPVDPRAGLLASRGYAVLELAYDESGGLPDPEESVPLEALDDAVEWLGQRERVRPEPVGVLGHSVGATGGLVLASHNDAVRAVVAYAPTAHVFRRPIGGLRAPDTTLWSRGGQPLDSIPLRWGLRDALGLAWRLATRRPVAFADAYAGGLSEATGERREAAAIPVEDVGGPVLVVSGSDDSVWPAGEFGDRIVERLDESDYEHPYRHLSYERAGHGFSVPYLPVTDRTTAAVENSRLVCAQGGTPEGYASADADAWPRVLSYLERGLRSEAGPERIR